MAESFNINRYAKKPKSFVVKNIKPPKEAKTKAPHYKTISVPKAGKLPSGTLPSVHVPPAGGPDRIPVHFPHGRSTPSRLPHMRLPGAVPAIGNTPIGRLARQVPITRPPAMGPLGAPQFGQSRIVGAMLRDLRSGGPKTKTRARVRKGRSPFAKSTSSLVQIRREGA